MSERELMSLLPKIGATHEEFLAERAAAMVLRLEPSLSYDELVKRFGTPTPSVGRRLTSAFLGAKIQRSAASFPELLNGFTDPLARALALEHALRLGWFSRIADALRGKPVFEVLHDLPKSTLDITPARWWPDAVTMCRELGLRHSLIYRDLVQRGRFDDLRAVWRETAELDPRDFNGGASHQPYGWAHGEVILATARAGHLDLALELMLETARGPLPKLPVHRDGWQAVIEVVAHIASERHSDHILERLRELARGCGADLSLVDSFEAQRAAIAQAVARAGSLEALLREFGGELEVSLLVRMFDEALGEGRADRARAVLSALASAGARGRGRSGLKQDLFDRVSTLALHYCIDGSYSAATELIDQTLAGQYAESALFTVVHHAAVHDAIDVAQKLASRIKHPFWRGRALVAATFALPDAKPPKGADLWSLSHWHLLRLEQRHGRSPVITGFGIRSLDISKGK